MFVCTGRIYGDEEQPRNTKQVGKGKGRECQTRQMDPGSDSLSCQRNVISETLFNDQLSQSTLGKRQTGFVTSEINKLADGCENSSRQQGATSPPRFCVTYAAIYVRLYYLSTARATRSMQPN